jgi:carboxymethylenebutenolidase
MSEKYDLGAIFDEHVADEFDAKDVAATMSTMTAEPFVNHVPTMIGGVGGRGVADFYDKYFVGHWPDDTEIIPVSRTVGTDKVVDELIMNFTHDVPMDTLLPGVAPTGRPVRLPVVVVMGFEGDKVAFGTHLLGSGVAARTGRPYRRDKPAGYRRRPGEKGARQGSACQ